MKPYQHKVHYYETDRMGITHHSNYIRWMEEARMSYLDEIGWSYARLEEEGIISPVRSVSGRYRATTTFGDVISVTARVAEFNGVVLRLSYRMENQAGETVFEGESEHCFLNRDGRILRVKRELPELYETLHNLAQDA